MTRGAALALLLLAGCGKNTFTTSSGAADRADEALEAARVADINARSALQRNADREAEIRDLKRQVEDLESEVSSLRYR